MNVRLFIAAAMLVAACGGDNNETNNSSNNGTNANNTSSSNNGTTTTNNGTASTNNGTTATNNGTVATNNGTAATNNGTAGTNNDADHITADVDGTTVRADAAEGGVEPMDPVVQLRKTTGDGSNPVQIFRITIPAVEVGTFDCSNPDVSVIYSELNGQLINNWASSDTCAIELTSVDPQVVGTFSATTSDGSTTVELTNGEILLTP